MSEQIGKVRKQEPVLTQEQYTTYVNRLSRMIEFAKAKGGSDQLIDEGKFLKQKCNAEYWLKQMCLKLQQVPCATSKHMSQIARLEKSILSADEANGFSSLVSEGRALLKKLKSEVELQNALAIIPEVRPEEVRSCQQP